MLFSIAPLNNTHQRNTFNCHSEALTRYFQQQVNQDIKRKITACFVALNNEGVIAGYYTLAASSMLLNDLPPDVRQKLPRYPSVPAVRMGRLAVDTHFIGLGLGGALVADALQRTLKSDIAAYAMVVDAKDETAVAFYQHHGFIRLTDSPLTLFLPLATAQKMIDNTSRR